MDDRAGKTLLVNQYDEVVIELEDDGFGYWRVPGDFALDTLSPGDVYRVVAYDEDGYEVE